MKKFLFIASWFLWMPGLYAQTDYSGSYGYSLSPEGKPAADETATGPSRHLVLVKMENNQYRFWLDIITGPPSYNRGETDGTVTFTNDTASFDNTFENATLPCLLKFRMAGNTLTISGFSDSFNCGFGNGVNADGNYIKLAVQPLLNNDWLKKQYPASPAIIITADKVEVFKDENGLYSKKYFLTKGDALLNITETERTIYTEYFTPAGKFICGWVKKASLKNQ